MLRGGVHRINVDKNKVKGGVHYVAPRFKVIISLINEGKKGGFLYA